MPSGLAFIDRSDGIPTPTAPNRTIGSGFFGRLKSLPQRSNACHGPGLWQPQAVQSWIASRPARREHWERQRKWRARRATRSPTRSALAACRSMAIRTVHFVDVSSQLRVRSVSTFRCATPLLAMSTRAICDPLWVGRRFPSCASKGRGRNPSGSRSQRTSFATWKSGSVRRPNVGFASFYAAESLQASANRFKKSPTSVTIPVDSREPRSASLVTTAGLMSTQIR